MEIEQLANELYTAYCAAVGGKAHDGNQLPTWTEMRADPRRKKQSDAWVVTAQAAMAQAGLAYELERGKEVAGLLVEHMARMNAANVRIPVALGEARCLVTAERLVDPARIAEWFKMKPDAPAESGS